MVIVIIIYNLIEINNINKLELIINKVIYNNQVMKINKNNTNTIIIKIEKTKTIA